MKTVAKLALDVVAIFVFITTTTYAQEDHKAGDTKQGGVNIMNQTTVARSTSPALDSAETKNSQMQKSSLTEVIADFGKALAGIIVALVLIFVIIRLANRSKARRYVLNHKGMVAALFAEADKAAGNSHVKMKTLADLGDLKERFSLINKIEPTSKDVDWQEEQKNLNSVREQLKRVISNMVSECSEAERYQRRKTTRVDEVNNPLKNETVKEVVCFNSQLPGPSLNSPSMSH